MRSCYILAVAVLTGCSAGASSNASLDVRTVSNQLDSLDRRFDAWVAAGQIDSIVGSYYATDATLLVAGSPPVRGGDQIRSIFEGFYKLGDVRGHIQRSALLTADSIATDIGHYEMRILDRADTTKVVVVDHGNYITSFVKRNGQWRAIYDAPVSDIPPAPPSPKSGGNK